MPQNVKELASSLPRYPKDLSVILVHVKSRDNTFKDVKVKKQNVHDALLWLTQNNPHYVDVQINQEVLDALPDNDAPLDLLTVETEEEIVSHDTVDPDLGPPTDNPAEDSVYNESNEMSSFLPVGEQHEQELNALRSQLSPDKPLS